MILKNPSTHLGISTAIICQPDEAIVLLTNVKLCKIIY